MRSRGVKDSSACEILLTSIPAPGSVAEIADRVRTVLPPLDSRRAMRSHRVAQQQVACAGGQDGRRESVHVAVDRRYQLVLQVVAMHPIWGDGPMVYSLPLLKVKKEIPIETEIALWHRDS